MATSPLIVTNKYDVVLCYYVAITCELLSMYKTVLVSDLCGSIREIVGSLDGFGQIPTFGDGIP